jgi:hypothetical protein
VAVAGGSVRPAWRPTAMKATLPTTAREATRSSHAGSLRGESRFTAEVATFSAKRPPWTRKSCGESDFERRRATATRPAARAAQAPRRVTARATPSSLEDDERRVEGEEERGEAEEAAHARGAGGDRGEARRSEGGDEGEEGEGGRDEDRHRREPAGGLRGDAAVEPQGQHAHREGGDGLRDPRGEDEAEAAACTRPVERIGDHGCS